MREARLRTAPAAKGAGQRRGAGIVLNLFQLAPDRFTPLALIRGLEVDTDGDITAHHFGDLHLLQQEFREVGVFRDCVLYFAVNFPIGVSRGYQPLARPPARVESREPKKFRAMFLEDFFAILAFLITCSALSLLKRANCTMDI